MLKQIDASWKYFQTQWVEVNGGKNTSYRSFDCNLQICIIKNDARCIPAKL